MEHTIAYEGLVSVSLAVMQEAYVPLYMPWINKRIGIEGTLQRPPYSLESGTEWVRSLDKVKGKTEVFAVLVRNQSKRKPQLRYIGHTSIDALSWPDGTASTGSIFGAADGRGRGYGTEAKLLLQYHAFMVMGVRKLSSTVKAWNAQSLGHLIKCGYQIIGRRKAHHFHEGTYGDEILLEVFREDWEPVWAKYQKSKQLPKLTEKQRALVTRQTTM